MLWCCESFGFLPSHYALSFKSIVKKWNAWKVFLDKHNHLYSAGQNSDYCQRFQCDYFMCVDQIGKFRSGAFLVYALYILALSVWPILYWEILDFHHFDVLTCAHWEHFKIGILFWYTFCVRTKTDIRDTQSIAVKNVIQGINELKC